MTADPPSVLSAALSAPSTSYPIRGIIQLSARSPSEFPIRAPADLERNADGFNASQSLALQDTNERHQPAASSPSIARITPPAQAVQTLGQSFLGRMLGWRPSGRLPTARNQRRIDDSRRSLQPGRRACQGPAVQHFPAAQQLAPMTDWLLFSPTKRLIYRRLPQCKVPGTVQYEHVPAHLSIGILFTKFVRPSTMLVS